MGCRRTVGGCGRNERRHGDAGARSRRIVGISALLAAALVVFAAGAIAWRYTTNPTTPAASVRFEIVPPPDVLLSPVTGSLAGGTSPFHPTGAVSRSSLPPGPACLNSGCAAE